MQEKNIVSWKCPSNIALVKYWGKYGRQFPRNPSISFTLDNAHTITTVRYTYNDSPSDELDLQFLFEGNPNPKFESKIRKFLSSVTEDFPFIAHLNLKIESENSFPHSSGIASSASSMAALSMCLLDIERTINNANELDYQRASFLARLGSGSACRSVFPKIAVWGESQTIASSSNDYAIPFHEGINPMFANFHDDILIVSKEEKSVSSRAGHALMENNPYSSARFAQAFNHMDMIIEAMKSGDIEKFGEIVEKEALTLHALMMSSEPPYILLEPQTLELIKAIQSFRKIQKIPVYFTLDAGPNIHLLYPDEVKEQVNELKDHIRPLCVDHKIIEDHVGSGPVKLL